MLCLSHQVTFFELFANFHGIWGVEIFQLRLFWGFRQFLPVCANFKAIFQLGFCKFLLLVFANERTLEKTSMPTLIGTDRQLWAWTGPNDRALLKIVPPTNPELGRQTNRVTCFHFYRQKAFRWLDDDHSWTTKHFFILCMSGSLLLLCNVTVVSQHANSLIRVFFWHESKPFHANSVFRRF